MAVRLQGHRRAGAVRAGGVEEVLGVGDGAAGGRVVAGGGDRDVAGAVGRDVAATLPVVVCGPVLGRFRMAEPTTPQLPGGVQAAHEDGVLAGVGSAVERRRGSD